jgi:hypothetical protein
LGNQMFQYAAARGIAPEDELVYFDHSYLELNNIDKEHFTAREYELGIFKNLKAQRAGKEDIVTFFNDSFYYRLIRFVLKKVVIRQHENQIISQTYLSKFRQYYLDGYFQSEKYFRDIRKQILREFEFPPLEHQNALIEKEISEVSNPVCIHIRRGDYLKSEVLTEVHGILPIAYYKKALGLLHEKYPDITLYIFSDDTAWVKREFNTGRFGTNVIEHNLGRDSWKDMALMSLCRHFIIANSSFSWWGAWLSQRQGEVFAPAKWFNPSKINFNIYDFVPNGWTIISDY